MRSSKSAEIALVFDVAAHVYAHRGLWGGDVPENSLRAFEAAEAAGVGVELDVRITGDDELVVFHDVTLDRLCHDDRRVDQVRIEDVRRMVLPDGSRIPSLQDALAALPGHPVLVEIKIDRNPDRTAQDRSTVRKVVDGLGHSVPLAAGMSFDEPAVRELARTLPGRPVGQLIEPIAESSTDEARAKAARALQTGATFLAPHLSALPVIAGSFPGVPLVTWTVRTPADLELARLHGAAPIFETISPALAMGRKATI